MVDIIHLNDDPHTRTQRLLSWHVTDVLEAKEAAQVEAHLRACAECREDFEMEKALARRIRTLPGDVEGRRRKAGRLRRFAILIPLLTFVLSALPAQAVPIQPSAGQGILVMLRMPLDHHRPDAAYGGDYGDQFTVAARRRMAQRIAHRYGLEFVDDGWPMPLLGVDCYVMRVRPDEMIETALKRIAGDPEIVWSQPMQVFRTDGSAPIAR